MVNVCIWFNGILFGFDFLYEKFINNNSVLLMINIMEFLNIVVKVIEKVDIFCLFVMVEFFLMIIDMLFIENDYIIYGYLVGKLFVIEERDIKICYIVKKIF